MMTSDDTARLLYLSLLLGVVGLYFVIANRGRMGQMLRHTVMWALIFVGVIAAYGLWSDVSQSLRPTQVSRAGGILEVPRDTSGHYSVVAQVNGAAIEFLVDTGASNVVLSTKDAKRAGIDVDNLMFIGAAQTANGRVNTAPVRIDTLQLGEVQDDNVKAYVTDGELFGSLLGMDYLQRFSKIEIAGDKLILTR